MNFFSDTNEKKQFNTLYTQDSIDLPILNMPDKIKN